MWEKISEFMCSQTGQVWCAILLPVFVVGYCFLIYFEDKWGDKDD